MYLSDFRHKTEVSRSRKIKITKLHFECAQNAENGIAELKIFVLEKGGGGLFGQFKAIKKLPPPPTKLLTLAPNIQNLPLPMTSIGGHVCSALSFNRQYCRYSIKAILRILQESYFIASYIVFNHTEWQS